jgi:hypothetical protein
MALIYGVVGRDSSIPKSLTERIMNMGSHQNNPGRPYVDSMIKHQVASHLIEKVLKVADSNTFHDIYAQHFRGQLKELSSDPVASYVIKTLVTSVKNEPQARMIAEEIAESLEQFLGEPGIHIVGFFACLPYLDGPSSWQERFYNC